MGNITITNLGKAYKQYPSRWGRLAEWLLPLRKPRHTLKWVLQNINFQIAPGEAVGIIGINGAGKSTLLKIITGTTQPTTGHVQLTGRIAALLELGMGFHPDFTGRQNALMAGQLLGYSAEDIQKMMPQIEEFAEIGDYIDQPVRVYSSGMQMRLAFSVATAHRPDVLIVDEALSVGDAYFQHKSFDRIRNFREKGTTLLLVSHDKTAIQSICDRAILLNAGQLVMEGEPEVVMDYYNAMLAERENQTVRQQITETGKVQTISGSGEAKINKIALLDEHDQPLDVVNVGQPVKLKVTIEATAPLPELVIGYMIKDRLGQPAFGTNTYHLNHKLTDIRSGAINTFVFSFAANLGPGSYSIAIALHTTDTHIGKNYEWRDLAAIFNVVNIDQNTFIGTAWLPPTVEHYE
ncbi:MULTISPECIES: ABC transporter ATP-binding protein [Stutzerimonas stutzeri group]|uniref:ABC transporter ATP-binding protein n=1 Tax=Stutzerimonas stutzeri group TaxID=136846 RepID=UPI000C4EAFC6|nr:ABC transporter ATP-binding protein [Stutzerimonas kunmingensis]MBB59832.1 sugar ABC transporter ATP-binding protein [Pseudomonas sp.]HAF90720.1 sugar ABC transporter ATP-binding protein [Pseudomonas sp.]|tara:strand:+ start:3559 stop:4779 length:1221 start_codon:yes stop_codon:yes gene_type:complete